MRFVFGLTIFLSAFLLFQVQPLIARFILPWFGGTPDTWTACLLFFQATLFAGYFYAWLLTKFATPARQAVIHLALLLVAAMCLPIIPSSQWKPSPGDADNPAFRILLLLCRSVGLPYLTLSATAPLIQHWISLTKLGRPYQFYSLSNLASLLALLSYPLIIEPLLRLRTQAWIWSAGFGFYVVLCGYLAIKSRHLAGETNAVRARDLAPPANQPRAGSYLQWLLFSSCGSMMLLATTNQISQDVAVVPLLWVAPLALYLLTFIICFANERWYVRAVVTPIFLTLAIVSLLALQRGAILHFVWQLAIYCGTMFVACLVTHGELARIKPPAEFLTIFYLCLAAGGALGGLFVSLIAPNLFTMLVEFEISLSMAAVILLFVYYRDRAHLRPSNRSPIPWPLLYLLALAVVAIAVLLNESRHLLDQYGRQSTTAVASARRQPSRILARTRNFYGTLVVSSAKRETGSLRSLLHGRILHGQQFAQSPLSLRPLTYYGTNSGVGFALLNHPKRNALAPSDRRLNIGDIGMGVGTLAAYGQAGDRICFYEINPDVIRLAKKHFTYLSESSAETEIILGDGRLSLERELFSNSAPRYDVFVVDAFSGDAVPAHLLTRECFRTYTDRLAPEGILALHVSSRFLDLTPLVGTLCQELGMRTFWADTPASAESGTRRAFWVLATKSRAFLTQFEKNPLFTEFVADTRNSVVWTDDHVNLLAILRRSADAK